MDGHRQKPGRRRRRKSRSEPRTGVAAPVMIVARRPDSPPPTRARGRHVAASAAPARAAVIEPEQSPLPPKSRPERIEDAPRRAARIVQLPTGEADEKE